MNTDTTRKLLSEIAKLTGELAKGKGTLALAGKGSSNALKFGKNSSDQGMSEREVEKNRDMLNKMADFVEWTAGEGRGAIDGLNDKMQKFDYELDQVSKSLPDTGADDTTNKQKELVKVFQEKQGEILQNCTNIARQIGGINCVYSAARAAVQAAYKNAETRKTAARDADMGQRIDGYLKKHPEATASEIAKAVGATAEDIKKHTTMVGGQEWPEKK